MKWGGSLSLKRSTEINRNTTEAKIDLKLNLDGTGMYKIDTGIPFFDHMLCLLTKHGMFDLEMQASGDIEVDYHHTVEDIGICLGKAINTCLIDKKGITRYGHTITPMDEALILTAIDISGRGYLSFNVEFPSSKVGNFDTELVEEFLYAFAINSQISLHVMKMSGRNCHHIIEAIFKGLGRCLAQSIKINAGYEDILPSTKGLL